MVDGLADRLRTPKEVVVRLGLRNEKTLAYWRMTGYGPKWLKLGRHIRYRDSDLEQFLAESIRANTSQG